MTIATIRTETAADAADVYRVHVEAFGGGEYEARLVERIRRSAGFVPGLSLVALVDGRIAGHLLMSEAAIEDGAKLRKTLVLAPIGVKPALQKQGIGGLLIGEGLSRGAALGYGAVLLIGHPTYYPRFGFQPARKFGLELKQFDVPDDVFMARELRTGALDDLRGELKYPPAFFG